MTWGGVRTGIAISLCPTEFAPLLFAGQLEEGLRVAGELGFDLVELSLRSPEDVDAEALRASLNRAGISLSAIATGQSCLFDSLCLSAADPGVRAATVTRLEAHIQLAESFGASVILGGIRGRLTGTPAERSAQRVGAVESIQECARLASSLGVTLLIEPINRYETNFINTAVDALSLLDEVDDPSLKVLLDTFHMNIEEAAMTDALKLAGDRLGYVHFADSNRLAPGQGHVDFVAVLETLEELGYRGVVAAEILPLPNDVTAARQTAEFWRRLAPAGGSTS